ncbi:MAG: DeoR/GlpR transcriptional regulator [Ruminococcaceae bacterium]|nr:DeoR/GlpR transcriptional regulator [Oscillospiraceae bacterium]
MLSKERQNKIQQLLLKNGAVTTSNLVNEFGVSLETIRRDLLSMEQAGMLSRVHGGAVTVGGMKPFFNLEERNKSQNEEKRKLSVRTAEFINEGDYIYVDTGSTAIFFAEVLKEKFSALTVVTHSLDVFQILNNHRDFTVILCAGHYLKKENSFYGTLLLDMLSRLHIKKAFLFPGTLSLEFGICDYNESLLQVQKKLLEISDEIYFLADSSKFECKSLLKLDDMKREYTYVTDSNLSAELKKLYIENGINIVT